MQKLETIAEKVLRNEMTIEEASNKIIVIIYEHRPLFNLSNLDEDYLIDFLIDLSQQFSRIFKIFAPERCSFTLFLVAIIKRRLRNYKRQLAYDHAVEESLFLAKRMAAEEDMYCYESEQPELVCEAALAREENERFTASLATYNPTANFDFCHAAPHPHCSYDYDGNRESLRKAACLILALKSSPFLDCETLRKISLVTGIDEATLQDMIEQLKKSMSRKLARWNNSRKSRDNAYFYHRKYLIEFLNLDTNCNLSEVKLQKYLQKTKLWQKKAALLSKPENVPVASNADIGKILNISPRRVGYIIRAVKQHIDMISFNHYDDDDENIHSNRKP